VWTSITDCAVHKFLMEKSATSRRRKPPKNISPPPTPKEPQIPSVPKMTQNRNVKISHKPTTNPEQIWNNHGYENVTKPEQIRSKSGANFGANPEQIQYKSGPKSGPFGHENLNTFRSCGLRNIQTAAPSQRPKLPQASAPPGRPLPPTAPSTP